MKTNVLIDNERLLEIVGLEKRIIEALKNEDNCARSDWADACLRFTVHAMRSYVASLGGKKAHIVLGFDIPKEHADYDECGGSHCWIKEIPAPATPFAKGTNLEFCPNGALFTTLTITGVEYKIPSDEYIYHCEFMAVDLIPVSSGKNAIATIKELGFRDGDLPDGTEEEPAPDLKFHLVFRSLDKSKPELSQCIVMAPTIEAALSMFGAPANGYEVVTITSQFEMQVATTPEEYHEDRGPKGRVCNECGRPCPDNEHLCRECAQ